MTRSFHDALNALAAREAAFFAGEFLAPVLRGRRVAVRIAGALCAMRVRPGSFQGWAVCRPEAPAESRVVRPATLAERRRYLEALPRVRLVLCERGDDHALGVPERPGAAVPVYLPEDAGPFEAVVARYDGARHWFDGADGRHNPATAAYLRAALRDMTEPDRLDRPGLTGAERAAYALARAARAEADRVARQGRAESKLREALGHAGGELRDFAEREEDYRVEYAVDGERHVSVVGKDDLAVRVAGICLNGEDARFDLQSLVGVLREARGEGALPVGEDNGGMPEEVYRRVHPPRG
jgi:hypothetical protein